MKQSSFTAKELFGMAYLAKKEKMYGVPDVLGAERNVALQTVIDELVSKKIADINIDGQIALRPEYFTTVNTYCDCERCMTVNARTENGTEHSYIFWLKDTEYVLAEVIDNQYVFTSTDPDMIKALISRLLCSYQAKELTPMVVIPQLEIVKAKRACVKGDYAETTRIIRQCGASPDVSNAIVDGLQGNAYYLGLVYMDMQTGECQKQDLSYVCNDGVLLTLGQTVANLRTCATFTPINCEDMHDAVKALMHRFLEKKE